MSAVEVARRVWASARNAGRLVPAWCCLSLAPLLAAQDPPARDTLCVLDFQCVGEPGPADWLKRGLADLMIHTLRSGPYLVLERERIRHLLSEHELASSGWVDREQAAERGHLVRADCVLLGSFALREERLVVGVRLLQLADQRLLTAASWQGPLSDVLLAPRELLEEISRQRGTVLDPRGLESISQLLPPTVDVAQAYYRGLGAFEDGDYPRALAHYLDAAGEGVVFLQAQREVLRLYSLLDQDEHAVLFAQDAARRGQDLPHALELHLAAAEHALQHEDHLEAAIEILEEAVDKAREHEHATGELAAVRRAFLEELRCAESPGSPERERHKSHRLLSREVSWGLSDDTPVEAEDTYFDAARDREGKWVTELLPYPSASMWRMRAQRFLARAHARAGHIDVALQHYKEVRDAIVFLDASQRDGPPSPSAALESEAHFMLLHHHRETGELRRDHVLRDAIALNVMEHDAVFERKFDDLGVDPRARVASRYPGRGHEYFDFAAPEGKEIAAVVLEAQVAGIASVHCYLPDPRGWPPKYSCSKRIERLEWGRPGTYRKRISPPPGTDFLSLSVEWGGNPYSDWPPRRRERPSDAPESARDLVLLRARFEVTAKRKLPTAAPPPDRFAESDRRLIAHMAGRDGWAEARVARPCPADDLPKGDVFAQEWLVFSMNGDLVICPRDRPDQALDLPATICTGESEYDPALVRTHAGGYALFWSRGTKPQTALRFVATTNDLKTWQTPRRLRFAVPDEPVHYTYAQSEPLERTYNICPIPGGYLMLLAQGFARESDDLCNWDSPRKILPQDLLQNRLLRTSDGMIWIVYERSSDAPQPYTADDPLSGYYVMDGKRYQHTCEIHVARSTDGRRWNALGHASFSGQASGLWAFPVAEDRIGVGVQFNARFVKWLASEPGGSLREVPASLALMTDTREATFFPADGRLICLRPVFDYFGDQEHVLLQLGSKELCAGLRGDGR